jgi:hypothetical protein
LPALKLAGGDQEGGCKRTRLAQVCASEIGLTIADRGEVLTIVSDTGGMQRVTRKIYGILAKIETGDWLTSDFE